MSAHWLSLALAIATSLAGQVLLKSGATAEGGFVTQLFRPQTVVGLGLYGLLVHPHPLRKLLGFNLLGSGVFLLFGIVARRGAAAGFAADPVPQALVITGIVVAFCGDAEDEAVYHLENPTFDVTATTK